MPVANGKPKAKYYDFTKPADIDEVGSWKTKYDKAKTKWDSIKGQIKDYFKNTGKKVLSGGAFSIRIQETTTSNISVQDAFDLCDGDMDMFMESVKVSVTALRKACVKAGKATEFEDKLNKMIAEPKIFIDSVN